MRGNRPFVLPLTILVSSGSAGPSPCARSLQAGISLTPIRRYCKAGEAASRTFLSSVLESGLPDLEQTVQASKQAEQGLRGPALMPPQCPGKQGNGGLGLDVTFEAANVVDSPYFTDRERSAERRVGKECRSRW